MTLLEQVRDAKILLDRARAAGLRVTAKGNHLVVRGPRTSEPLALQLLDAKPIVMPLLTASRPRRRSAPPLRAPLQPCPCGSRAFTLAAGTVACAACGARAEAGPVSGPIGRPQNPADVFSTPPEAAGEVRS